MLVGDDLMQVVGNRAHVAIDRPLVVVKHNNQAPGLLRDIVQRLEADAVGKSRIAREGNHILFGAGQIAGHRHAQSRGKGRTRVPRAIAVVIAFRAQGEAVQTSRLANGIKLAAPPGQQLMDIRLVADVENEAVFGSIEDIVHGERQLHHAQIGS